MYRLMSFDFKNIAERFTHDEATPSNGPKAELSVDGSMQLLYEINTIPHDDCTIVFI